MGYQGMVREGAVTRALELKGKFLRSREWARGVGAVLGTVISQAAACEDEHDGEGRL